MTWHYADRMKNAYHSASGDKWVAVLQGGERAERNKTSKATGGKRKER